MYYLKKIKPLHLIIIIFFFTNLLFLTAFPFVHSDEAWLSGLSRSILLKKNPGITEPFFDLYPRNPHAIKILFHLLQIFFIKLMGYNIFTFRFISLLAGTLSLYYFYKITKKITGSNSLANLAVIMMGVDIQFIYASHFARQEIILLLIMLISFSYLLEKYTYKNLICQDIIIALILGAGIGIHPNSFVIALPFILIYSYNYFISKKIKFNNYLAFGGTLTLIALFFLVLSFRFDPDFINNYTAYGQSLGVSSPILLKISRLGGFYKKLFHSISATYYTPSIKFQFIIFAFALLSSPLRLSLIKKNKIKIDEGNILLLLMFVGINLAYIIIGRYNQTSIIFIFPISYLLILSIVSALRRKYSFIILTLIIIILAANTITALINNSYYDYNEYLAEIKKVVDKGDSVLANLNAEYCFDNAKLRDYRNLAYLELNEISFSEYITSNMIEYIIYPEEMDFIFNSRPIWNTLYGNLHPYYQDMQEFFNNNCTLVHSFSNRTYGMRIARYIGKEDWEIKIYKVAEMP